MPPEGNSAPLLIRNARVITCDADFSIHDSVLIDGDRLGAVGPAATLASKNPDARTLDAGGRAIIPGLMDGHAHLDREGLKSVYPSLAGCASIGDILERIEKLVADAEPGDWIVTMPIGEPPYYFGVPGNLAEKRFPTRHELDSVSPDNPVYIRPIWGTGGTSCRSARSPTQRRWKARVWPRRRANCRRPLFSRPTAAGS